MPLSEAERIELQREVESIYFAPEEARAELRKRWKDKKLRKKVELFIGKEFPEVFLERPRAVLARQVLSPNFETLGFEASARKLKLSPVCFGYLDDKLVMKNLDKYFLCRLYFEGGVGKRGGAKVAVRHLLDFNAFNGKRIRNVMTNFGMNFVDFHNELTSKAKIGVDFFDGSNFLQKHGSLSRNYYRYLLALFVCHGVLFENYLMNGEYGILTKEVFWPNYKAVKDYFGVKPLIVRLTEPEREDDLHWRYYPSGTLTLADTLMKQA